MPTPLTTRFPQIKADGNALQPDVANRLIDLEIESTYNRPDLCTLTYDLDANAPIPPAFDLGKAIEVSFTDDNATVAVFKGEVTALDFDGSGERSVFILQCEDKFHRLFRMDKTRTFVKQTVKDAAMKMASDNALTGDVSGLTTRYDFLMQQNVSDAAWLIEHVTKRNLHVRVDDTKLVVKQVGSGGDAMKVKYGDNLISFNARVTANAYLKEAAVKGWDVKQKQAIEGKATSYSGTLDSKVASANGPYAATTVLVRTGDALIANEAEEVAKATMARGNEANRQAEGKCFGSPKLKVDTNIEIEGVNARFNGKYLISRVRHRYSLVEGYMTEFSCRGASDQSISGLLEEATAAKNRGADRHIFDGVAIGIVTNVKDDEKLGRVKVKFPTLPQNAGQDNESDWMRVVFPGGGGPDHHGWYLLPEVNDEVLVIFEQGDARRGYVLGGLLNGKDKPFYDQAVDGSGKVNQHAFRLKNGAHLLFDEKDSAEMIELKSKGDNFIFKFEEKNGVTLKNQSSGDKLVIDNKGKITITSQSSDIAIEAGSGKLSLKAAQDISIESTGGKVSIKAAQDATVEGLNAKLTGTAGAEVKGNATAKLEASGQTTVKGAMVMIN